MPMVLVSVHDEQLYRSCLAFLESFGYSVLISTQIAAFERGNLKWTSDPDLLAVPPQRKSEFAALGAIPWFAAQQVG